MAHKVTLIPGDGIGPEVTQAVVRILEATGVAFEWDRYAAGAEAFEIYGEYIPQALYESIERNKVALKGPVTTPIGGGFKSINVTLRKKFDLFANFRPIKNLPGLETKFPNVDLIIVRENTEGEYVGLEHEVVPGVVESLKVITEKGSTRIAKFAFEYARKHGRKKIHSIHKANIMKLSDGLFLRCARKVAEEYPDVQYGEHIIDNTCMQLVMNPWQYDTLLLENLYGDIVSDLCAAFVGGLGLVPGANLGVDCAIFEAVHGSAPDIAGKDLANPTALLQSAILMLRHLDEETAADKVQRALETVYTERKALTRDVGGTAGTTEFAEAVVRAVARGQGPGVRGQGSDRSVMHYLLIYEASGDYLERRGEFRALHLKLAWEAVERGELLLGGALADPVDGAVLLFKGESPEVAEKFVRADPYVANGLVKSWRVRPWTTVVGEGAATVIRPDDLVCN